MHIEFLVEDRSGARLIESIAPRVIGSADTFRVHAYKGLGHLPRNLRGHSDPKKRILLDQLPRLLQGYGKTSGIDAVVVVVDNDRRDCKEFLDELRSVWSKCRPRPRTVFRLAIEETEAWLLGSRDAVSRAYPKAKSAILAGYKPDSITGTWEVLADAIHPGGRGALLREGYAMIGSAKSEWADKIGPLIDINDNRSPSFQSFVRALRTLAAQ